VIVIEGAYLACADPAGTEYPSGHLVLDGVRITAVGPGPAPEVPAGATGIDGTGCLVTPGLVNTHHHLYQWISSIASTMLVAFVLDLVFNHWLPSVPRRKGLVETAVDHGAITGRPDPN
jgi:cytosine/adenosine deaminase-related metal-dependent hydrolase